jgi:hypothetical protein
MKTIELLGPLAALSLAALSLAACGGDDTDTSAATTTTTTTSSSGDPGSTSSTSGSSGSGGSFPSTTDIMINEINARSPNIGDLEWVEIANTGSTAFNLNGYGVADTDSLAPGSPNIAGALHFPVDAVIPAGGYFIVLCDQAAEMPPVKHVDCVPGTPAGTVCYYVTWKVSAGNGERVFFLDPNNGIAGAADYPDPLVVVPSPVDGQTWARIPDMTGDFAIGTPTPGGPNMAPP